LEPRRRSHRENRVNLVRYIANLRLPYALAGLAADPDNRLSQLAGWPVRRLEAEGDSRRYASRPAPELDLPHLGPYVPNAGKPQWAKWSSTTRPPAPPLGRSVYLQQAALAKRSACSKVFDAPAVATVVHTRPSCDRSRLQVAGPPQLRFSPGAPGESLRRPDSTPETDGSSLQLVGRASGKSPSVAAPTASDRVAGGNGIFLAAQREQ